MGVSEAFYIPAALALIADYHVGTTRSRAVGLHQIAIYFGVIAGGFGGYAAADPNVGWRLTFTACGVFGMLYALPLVILLRDPAKSEERLPRSEVLPGRGEGIVRQSLLHLVGPVLHAAGYGGLGGARLDAIDPQKAVRHRTGAGGGGGDALLASRGHHRGGGRRLAGGSVDAAESAREDIMRAPSA